MKTIIAGSRTLNLPPDDMQRIVTRSRIDVTEVVCGMCDGIDISGRVWGKRCGLVVTDMPATWIGPDGKRDNAAGIKRNVKMAQYAEALIAVWDGRSPGTKHMITEAQIKGLVTFVWLWS